MPDRPDDTEAINAHAAETLARYRERFQQFGISAESLGWRPQTAIIRFEAAWRDMRRLGDNFSLLDVGCGFGEFLPFLRERGWRGRYVGVDIVPEFIAVGKELGDGNAAWLCGDVMTLGSVERCDAAFASGVLNHRRAAAHDIFVESFLERLAALTKRFIAVDFLSTSADRRRDDLSFESPARLAELGARFSKRFVVDHSYMPYEMMLKIWFEDGHADGVSLFEAP